MNENDNWIIENCPHKDPDICELSGRYKDGGEVFCMHGYETLGYQKCPYVRKIKQPNSK
ncbi:hypothetical protein ACFL2P_02965 [Candidatus Moduliflexota bacterium]